MCLFVLAVPVKYSFKRKFVFFLLKILVTTRGHRIKNRYFTNVNLFSRNMLLLRKVVYILR